MANLAQQSARDRQRLFGRLGGALLFGSGLVTLFTVPFPAPPGTIDRPALVVITAVAMVAGALGWVAPWDRWSRSAVLWMLPVAFGLIAAGNYYGADSDPRSYGVFFVIAFVYLGVSQPPWVPLMMSPIAATAYLTPLLLRHLSVTAALNSTSLTIPVCVLVGEALAIANRHLMRTEEELHQQREDVARLKAQDELRTTFMTAVSHELRTPITIVRGHLEVLGSEPDPVEVKETMDVVIDELARMGRIVGDITTLVRIEDPAFLQWDLVSLDRFVYEVAAKASPLLGPRLRVDPPPMGTVTADPQRLTQALLNLLQNAAVHTNGDGPIELRVRRRGGGWRFEVEDSGGGVPAGLEEDLFQPFKQGSSASPGTGLGLAIVRGIAEAHGGSAGLANRPGEGATFWVVIPA
ncbi:MAG TPA: HAMP domain-containing sensor histidine kinase [Actinomycetota bacterium]|nr:HAMP domain-containing sensor histidine kinase [Actinomycetota bacterium]